MTVPGQVPVTAPNPQGVCEDGHGGILIPMPRARLTKPEALALAAQLVARADDNGEFGAYLAAARRG